MQHCVGFTSAESLCRNKTCTVLHQVGFYLTYTMIHGNTKLKFAGVGFTIEGVWSVCVYIFYIAHGDQVKYNSIFGKREGWGVWSSCGRI